MKSIAQVAFNRSSLSVLDEGQSVQEQEFVYGFPLFSQRRTEDGCVPMHIPTDDREIAVAVFTEEILAKRALRLFDVEMEPVAIENISEFQEACEHWMIEGATHVAFAPESHSAFPAPISEFIGDNAWTSGDEGSK